MIKVYVDGKARINIRVGRKAGEFGKENATFVLMRRSGSKVVKASYALQAGDTLVVTQRGVGGL